MAEEQEQERSATASPPPKTSPPAAAVAAAAPPTWEVLPYSILVRVSTFLPCRADRVHMACVNKHWHAAVTGLRRCPPPPVPPALPPLPQQLPWLIFPSSEAPTFYSALGRRFHRLCRLPPDVRRARFCGSGPGGWLLLALDSRHAHALYNLNSGQRILVPREFVSPTGTLFPLVVLAATLYAPLLRNRHILLGAIVLVARRYTAAFWNEGRENWFSAPTGLDVTVTLQDVIFFQGGFFFVTSDEDVISFWPLENTSVEGDVVVARLEYVMQQREDHDVDAAFVRVLGRTRRYLVESRGSLLMVVRYIYHDVGTRMLRVFRFRVTAPGKTDDGQLPRATWDDLGRELDGRMLFLGPGCSRSFEVADYDGLQDQDSMIFFLDDSFNSEPSADGRRFYSFTDIGRYSMSLEEIASEPWPPGARPTRSDNAPPTWWFQ